MNRYLRLGLASALVALLAMGCAQAPGPPTVPKQGTAASKRIVSLTPNNTEVLFALGLGGRVVGVTKWCDYPPEAREKPKVGDVNISLERVVGLQPDLVLAHTTLNRNIIRRLRQLKIRVVATDPKTLAEVISDIRLIGNATDTAQQAEKLVRTMETSIAAVRKRAAGGQRLRTLVVIQPSPLWAAGPDTFVDEMIGIANGENIAHDARPGFNLFSTETAIARNPEVIIVTRPEERAFFEENSLWRRTQAVRNRKVITIEPALLLRAGPRLVQGLERLAAALGGGR